MSPRPRRKAATAPPPSPTGPTGATRWTRWLAYALIAVYGIYWATTAFRVHLMGNMGVETDFYWKYGPAARDLLRGVISIGNYDSKGFGYPMAVAALSLFGLDVFVAGQIIALLSAVAVAWIVHRIHRRLFGPIHALASLAVLFVNLYFVENTYEVGTDMFFLALVLGSIALLIRARDPGTRGAILSGLLAGWAFSTRYNGLFLLVGALLLFLVYRIPEGPPAARRRLAAVWGAGFFLAALPWLIVNAVHTGNALTNSNYMNVGYAVYGEGKWDQFFFGERKIHTLLDVVRLDPIRFLRVMFTNTFEHLWRDGVELMPWPFGLLALLGAILLWRDRIDRRIAGYLTFGALSFGTLVPVFYGARFSLAVLPFYAALVAWPIVSPTLGRPLAAVERMFPLRGFAFLCLAVVYAMGTYGQVHDPRWPEAVQVGPYELGPAVSYLKQNAAPDDALLARKPHAAFLAKMRFVPMTRFETPDSLHSMATRERARYVLVSAAEVTLRQGIEPFTRADFSVPGFRRVFVSEGALLYEVLPTGAGGAPGAGSSAP